MTDGRHAAAFALLGNYMAGSFVAVADGHGGTLITEANPQQQQPLLTHPPTAKADVGADQHKARLGLSAFGGAFLDKIALKEDRGTMADFKYVDGASVLKPVSKAGSSSASLR